MRHHLFSFAHGAALAGLGLWAGYRLGVRSGWNRALLPEHPANVRARKRAGARGGGA